MPSTYTLNNGIELIGTGEQSGTWGDTTNTNLELLDSALDGQVTVTLASAGSSGSPNALPISDGAASNGRNRMVVFDDSSDLGATAYVQLTPNDAEKIIYIRNDLSGSRSIILFQGTYNASNDYEVPAGTTAVVYFDGAGSGAVAANVFNNAHFDAMNVVGNVTVGGNATVAGTVDAATVEFDNLSGTGAVSVTNILDEDNMASDSATALATQQSIKAYVDSQVTAQDLDFAGGTGTGSVDLDSQTFTVAGTANEIETSASGQTITVGLPDAVTIAALTATTADINGGTIDGTVIGGTTPAAISGTTGQFGTSLNVDGTVTADGLGVVSSSNLAANISNPTDTAAHHGLKINTASINSLTYPLYVRSNDVNRFVVKGNGDITFYDFSGNESFVYDESAGSTFNEQGADRDFRVESDSRSDALTVDGGESVVGINSGGSTAATLYINQEQGSRDSGIYITDGGYGTQGVAQIFLSGGIGDNNRFHGHSISSTRTVPYSDGTVLEIKSEARLGNSNVALSVGTFGNVIINDGGGDLDFRVESDAQSHALFVEGSSQYVGINTSGSLSPIGSSGGGLIVGPGSSNGDVEIDVTASGAWNRINSTNAANWGYGGLQYYNQGSFRWQMISQGGSEVKMSSSNDGSTIVENARFAPSGFTFNEGGGDLDFRVESDTDTHAFFLDASSDRIGMGTSSPTNALGVSAANGDGIAVMDGATARLYLTQDVSNLSAKVSSGNVFLDLESVNATSRGMRFFVGSTAIERMNISDSALAINDSSQDYDFRVESDGNANMLKVDAGDNQVVIGSSSTTSNHALRVNGSVGTYGVNVDNTAASASTTVDIPFSSLAGRGTYMVSYSSYANGGSQQNGFMGMVCVMTTPERASGTVIAERYTSLDSITYSGSNVRIVFTNTSGFTHLGAKLSMIRLT